MSVLKNLRKVSRYEFEYHYTTFYEEYREKVLSIPHRKQKYVATPLLEAMNSAYEAIMQVHQYLFTKKKYRKEDRNELIKVAINKVYAIQKPLFVFWNIQRIPVKKQVRWCEFLNKEIDLLNKLLEDKVIDKRFIIIDWESVNQMKFMKNMCDLHSTIHTKLIHSVPEIQNCETPLLAQIIDKALYELMLANNIYPQNKNEYLTREDKINTVITLLNDLAIPLCSYFSIMRCNELEQRKVIQLIEKEEVLLNGLLKSDSKHFSYLLTDNTEI